MGETEKRIHNQLNNDTNPDDNGPGVASDSNYSDLDKDFEDIMNNIRKRNEKYSNEKQVEDENNAKKTNKKSSKGNTTDQNNNGHHKKSSGSKDKQQRINDDDDNDPLLRYSQHRKDMEEIMKLWN